MGNDVPQALTWRSIRSAHKENWEATSRMARETISRCAWEAGFDDCLVIVPVVVTRDEVENSPFRSSLLMQAVRSEGIPV